jgi:arylformamidase
MKAEIISGDKSFRVDFSKPIDISIPLRAGEENVNAFYIPPVKYEPFCAGSFIGDVNQGGSCNVFNVSFNPHGNGTHTESVGHISKEKYPIFKCLIQFFFIAELISVNPEEMDGDSVITLNSIKGRFEQKLPEALIIRTLPNDDSKINKHYSGTNPAYMSKEAADFLRQNGIKHVLLDVPSIDKEDDGGKLSAHHEFWNYPSEPRIDCTISELIYVPENVADGSYLLNIQIASFDNDASPSKPVLYYLE